MINFRKHKFTAPSLLVAGLAVLALLLSSANLSLVNSATITIEPSILGSNEKLPVNDPDAAIWTQAGGKDVAAIVVPMSAQQMVRPSGGSTKAVVVRAVASSEQLAIKISWHDDTMNNQEDGYQASDAVAVQWPMKVGEALPFQCMGQLDAPVNIWQWKASLQTTNETTGNGQPPVYNLMSNGICKAADAAGMIPQGHGVWGKFKDETGAEQTGWSVVFSRKFSTGDANSAAIEPGHSTNVAFAVWNGAPGIFEQKSRKAVASWVQFNVVAGTKVDLTWLNLILILGASVVLIGLALKLTPRTISAQAVVASPQVDTEGRPAADTPANRALKLTARSRRM